MQGLFMLYIVQRVLPKQFNLSLISTQKIFQVQYSMKEHCGNLRCAVMFFFKQLALLRSAKDTGLRAVFPLDLHTADSQSGTEMLT